MAIIEGVWHWLFTGNSCRRAFLELLWMSASYQLDLGTPPATSLLLWHMFPLNELTGKQRKIYTRLEMVVRSCDKKDLKVVLGDFNAVSGNARLQGDTVLGPWGSGSPNENSDFLFCRGCQLSITGSWFQRKDIFTDIPGSPTTGKHKRR